MTRACFDSILATEAERQGAEIRYRHEVVAVDITAKHPRVNIKSAHGEQYQIEAGFLLDASGFGRVLPRLLQLEMPSDFPVRAAIFTHLEDNITASNFDRNKIRITIHPQYADVWYWLIQFANGRCSLGVVAENAFLARYQGNETERLQSLVNEDASLRQLLANARWDTPARQIIGYAANENHCGAMVMRFLEMRVNFWTQSFHQVSLLLSNQQAWQPPHYNDYSLEKPSTGKKTIHCH